MALPLIRPIFSAAQADLQVECINDVVAASGALLALNPSLHRTPLEFRYYSSPEDLAMVARKWVRPSDRRDYSLLVVLADVEPAFEDMKQALLNSGLGLSGDGLRRTCLREAIHELQMEVTTLVLLANVLRPGSLSVSSGFAFAGRKYIGPTSAFYGEDWSGATDAVRKYNWPTFRRLSIRDAWAWLKSTSCLQDGIGRGPCGRALAALSNVAPELPSDERSLNLAWILLALETLYCKGNVGLREQLVAKSERVLGPRSQNKKDFGAMYDFRSRLIHGDLDFPLSYSMYDAAPDYEDHRDSLAKYEGLGLAAVLATLQLMIENSWGELNFEYSVVGTPVSVDKGN